MRRLAGAVWMPSSQLRHESGTLENGRNVAQRGVTPPKFNHASEICAFWVTTTKPRKEKRCPQILPAFQQGHEIAFTAKQEGAACSVGKGA
jgi:hypothetical protein